MRYRIPDLGSGHGKTEEDDRHTGCEGRQSGRMLAWQIQAAGAGYSVEKYLTGRCGFTKTQVRRLKFRKHGMQVNGMQVRSTYLLSEGEVLSVCLDDSAAESHEMEASGTVPEILYEDADVVAVWKPAGEVVHPSHGHYQDTLANRLQSYFQGRGEHVTIRSIGRLDADTAGILIFAKNQFAAQRLWRQRENGQFHKTYAAWCEGVFAKEAYREEQSICAPIGAMAGELQKMCVTDSGRPAKTYYQVRIQRDTEAFLILRLDTGRTHQIRVHMAWTGHPLLGDPLYGNGISGRTRADLTAWRAEFCQPMTGDRIVILKDPLDRAGFLS